MDNYYTKATNFYGDKTPETLIEKYGSPLYVYNESILRQRCREMTSFVSYPNFTVNYSSKANSNLEILRIIRQEGLHADAISPGEVYVLLQAGFKNHEIFYISNNISKDEMLWVIEQGICLSVDSLSQLRKFGEINPGGDVAIRLNPGIGVGHHKKVITAGKDTKFGINFDDIPQIKQVADKYNLRIIGINQHLGSLFMDGDIFLKGAKLLLSVAKEFPNLEFVDFGGGFGIPYHKQEKEPRLELNEFGERLTHILDVWVSEYGKNIEFKIEPGRYIVAECGVLFGKVHSIKENHDTSYVGTDIGFNVLTRPMLYDSYHDIEVYKLHDRMLSDTTFEEATIVGNICESGDIIAHNRLLPEIKEGDILGITDVGAYGYAMSSNYNNRFRPAEVLITPCNKDILIRRRDTFDTIMNNFIVY